MKRDFNGAQITQRTKDSFFNATELLAVYNANNTKKKRFKDFWENKTTKNLYKYLLEKLGVVKLHESIRGKGGATWMHEELLVVFFNWINKLPNQSITRDEATFVTYLKESFEGVLTFETQKLFCGYFVDMYCPELKLCVEFDEEYHKKLNQVNLDKERQSKIENSFDVSFLRHDASTNFSIAINKIMKKHLSREL
jgi:very-short-patch-repair endonuclease